MQGILFIQDLALILVVAGAVGWICQRLGLSVVFGFLVAGIVVGPGRWSLSLVADADRVQTLAQVGLVFLMFAIGLRLSLRKLRRLGLPLLAATVGGSIAMYYLTRLLAASLGWTTTQGLFLAGMLMVSSSAIIGKLLHEAGVNHERSGQLALAVSVLEDLVAVVMLTSLHALVQLDGARSAGSGWGGLGSTLGHLGAFVALIGIAGLLIVPWLLKRMSIAADEDLQTLGVGALLFGLALLAQRAGYSLALGAFLLGIIIAETPHRHQVERIFEGMRDIFSAVFFVAVGMQINLPDLAAEAGLIVGVAAFVLVARPLALTAGLSLIGIPAGDALRAGLMGTPIGEFSFIIAQVGVAAAVLPPRFYPLAVGVSLLTTLAAPALTRHSGPIAEAMLRSQPHWLRDWMRYYRDWIERLRQQRNRSPLWRLSRKRFIQIGVEVAMVSGLLLFSRTLFAEIQRRFGAGWGASTVPASLFWLVLTLLIITPLVAIWRNCSALALLFAQVSTSGHPRARRVAPFIEGGLKLLAGTVLTIWIISIVPWATTARWLIFASALAALAVLLLLRRKLIYWHSVLEVELQAVLVTSENRLSASAAPWLQPHTDWDLQMIDCTLPDLADCQGRRIDELDLRNRFGCTIVGIEREGFMIPLPAAEAVLYPRDKVLLLGTSTQVRAGRAFLAAVSGAASGDSVFDDVRMESLALAPACRAIGRTLAELSPARAHGVQIAGIHRGGVRILNPGAGEVLCANDELLALGPPQEIREFRLWLAESGPEPGSCSSSPQS
jgi:CPA2 family monovalent cation:H+ antiporter-2